MVSEVGCQEPPPPIASSRTTQLPAMSSIPTPDEPGLQKLFHPAIPDGRTWSKFGEHGQHGEHGKDGKHQPDDSKVTRRLLKEKSKLTFVDF